MKRAPSARVAKAWTVLMFVGLFLLTAFLFWLADALVLSAIGGFPSGDAAAKAESILTCVVIAGLAVATLIVSIAGFFLVLLPKRHLKVAFLWRVLAYVSFGTFASALAIVAITIYGLAASYLGPAFAGGTVDGFDIVVFVFLLILLLALGGFIGLLLLTCAHAFQSHYRADFRGTMLPRFREIRRSLNLVRRSPLTLAGILMVIVIVTVALLVQFAPALIVPYPRDGGAVYYPPPVEQPPSWEHLFGTDSLGRDLLSRVLISTPLDLMIAALVVGSALVIGILLGIVSGFFGGWIDEAIMRITDIFLSIPGLILAIAFASALGPGVVNLMGALIIVWWPGYTRLIRGQTLSIRESLYIEAARAVGAKNRRIILRHLLPNALAPVLVNSTLDIGGVILVAAALGFLGLGQPPPLPEWGRLIVDGQAAVLRGEWWLATFPGIAILLTSLAFNLVGDGLRDILDPRLRR